jgi:hypothetical protein
VLEQYSFNPSDMFARVTIKDYLQFLVYGLEYRALVMEQMSHEKETKYLAEHPNVEDREDGYGVVLLNFCIRDLQGEMAVFSTVLLSMCCRIRPAVATELDSYRLSHSDAQAWGCLT